MPAAEASRKMRAQVVSEARAGTIALLALRLVLMGCVVALLGTLGSVVWKSFGL